LSCKDQPKYCRKGMKLKVVIGVVLSMLLMMSLALPAAAEIESPEVKADVVPGDAIKVEKLVTLSRTSTS